MRARQALTSFIDDLLYSVVLQNKHLSDHAELPDIQYRAIRFLGRAGFASMGEIAKFLGVSLPRTTKVVDEMIRGGLAKRVSTTDRRKVLISLTETGESVIAEARIAHEQLSESILSPLTKEERETMYRLLSKCSVAAIKQARQ